MKYLFHVHSFVNYVTALGVIDLERIDKKDVVFAIARGISLNSGCHEFTIPNDLYSHPFNNLKKLHTCRWLNNKSKIKAIDTLINENIDSDGYHYFAPHSRGYLYQVFITHPKCRGVNYIEDGRDAYMSRSAFERKFPSRIKWYQKFMRKSFFLLPFFQKNRLGMYNNPFKRFFDQPVKLYGLSDKSFSALDYIKATVININNLNLNNIPSYSSGTDLFLFEALIEQELVTFELLESFIHWFTAKNNQIDVLNIKFHPGQSKEMRDRIVEVFKRSHMKVSIVSDKVPVELVYIKNKELNIYGFGTSLLIYGSLLGKHNVNILYPYFSLKHNHYSKQYKDWKDLYSENRDVSLLGREISL